MASLSENDVLIRGVGDLLLGDSVPPHREDGVNQVAHLLRSADIAFGNMESPLVDDGVPISKIDVARSPVASASRLRELGFRVVSLANNHIMDYGSAGHHSTCSALDEAGISYAGTGHEVQGAFAPALFHSGNLRVAFFACHAYFNARMLHYTDPIRATSNRAGAAVIQGYRVRVPGQPPRVVTAPEESHLTILTDAVRRARSDADIVLMSLHTHWDKDDVDHVSDARRLIVREAIAAGVDLVLGHGPHVVNGIEAFQGRFAVHSMGNFFFCIPHAIAELYPAARPFINVMTREDRFWLGMLTEAVFQGGKPPESLRLIPLTIERQGPNEGLPRLGGADASRALHAVLEKQSAPLGVSVTLEADSSITARAAVAAEVVSAG